MRAASFCWSPVRRLKNSAVPDLAMVPRCEIASSRLMPMPLSRIVSVPAAGSASIQMASSPSLPSSDGSDSDRNRSLSLASEALEMSSRRKISLWLYREWIISWRSSRTSAWKLKLSRSLDMSSPAGLGPSADQTAVWGRGPMLSSQPSQPVLGRADPVVQVVPEQEEYFHERAAASEGGAMLGSTAR